MWIKICGNTRPGDCLLAAELGADAVGFVFAPGKRTVTSAQVAAITRSLPNTLETVGVFTSRVADEIADAALEAGLTGVQLHGALDEALARKLHERFAREARPVSLLQVLHWDVEGPAADQAQRLATQRAAVEQAGLHMAVLVDSRTQQASGGTGVTFDWGAAQAIVAVEGLPVIVAGGLNPGNVADAVRILRPGGVDVSSGVEHAPGQKDPETLRRFIQNARSAAAALELGANT